MALSILQIAALTSTQIQQPLDREDDSEDADAAERPERPDKKVPAASLSCLVDPSAAQMKDRHQQREESDEQHYDVTRHTLVEHHRSIDKKSESDDADHVKKTRGVESMNDIIDDMKRQQQQQEQRRIPKH